MKCGETNGSHSIYATATGVESGRNVGFAGVTGVLVEGNNNNLA